MQSGNTWKTNNFIRSLLDSQWSKLEFLADFWESLATMLCSNNVIVISQNYIYWTSFFQSPLMRTSIWLHYKFSANVCINKSTNLVSKETCFFTQMAGCPTAILVGNPEHSWWKQMESCLNQCCFTWGFQAEFRTWIVPGNLGSQ